ncbi:MAG TPA: hypothetical protein VFY17_05505 [Pilimelia sp.]|nr:hypothetical protein [Pilimelia sp.]
MPFEVLFAAGYSLLLTGGALGLHRLGRVDPSPWSSRALAGYRAQAPEPPAAVPPEAFPHRDAGRLHSAVAAVACVAALLVAATQLARHHRPAEVVLLAGCTAAAAAALRPVLRGALPGPRPGATPADVPDDAAPPTD